MGDSDSMRHKMTPLRQSLHEVVAKCAENSAIPLTLLGFMEAAGSDWGTALQIHERTA